MATVVCLLLKRLELSGCADMCLCGCGCGRALVGLPGPETETLGCCHSCTCCHHQTVDRKRAKVNNLQSNEIKKDGCVRGITREMMLEAFRGCGVRMGENTLYGWPEL